MSVPGRHDPVVCWSRAEEWWSPFENSGPKRKKKKAGIGTGLTKKPASVRWSDQKVKSWRLAHSLVGEENRKEKGGGEIGENLPAILAFCIYVYNAPPAPKVVVRPPFRKSPTLHLDALQICSLTSPHQSQDSPGADPPFKMKRRHTSFGNRT